MIWEGRRYGFRVLHLVLEDERAEALADRARYQLIHVRSHRPLHLDGFEVRTKTTHLIDLEPDEGEILARFHAGTRRKIRQSERDPSLSFASPDPERDAGYRLYADFERARDHRPSPRPLFGESLLFSARRHHRLIAGVFVDPSPSILRVRAFFSSRHQTTDRPLLRAIGFANRRVVWEACRIGKARGFRALDLASINAALPGIAAFKSGFGGRPLTEWIYVWRSPLIRLLERVRALRSR